MWLLGVTFDRVNDHDYVEFQSHLLGQEQIEGGVDLLMTIHECVFWTQETRILDS